MDSAACFASCLQHPPTIHPTAWIAPTATVLGSPAKVVRSLTLEEQAGIRLWAEKYIGVARAFRERDQLKRPLFADPSR